MEKQQDNPTLLTRREVLCQAARGVAALSLLSPQIIPAEAMLAPPAAQPGRTRTTFDFAWRFMRGDPPGAQQPGCDDSAWRELDLPHDWSIEGPYDQAAPASGPGGYLPTGIAWYRRHFPVPDSDRGRIAVLEFDGVCQNSDVWINGHHLGQRPNGFVPFAYELTPHLLDGADNVVAVRVDNSRQTNCRWYSGSGIYRHTWLLRTDPLRIGYWGVWITTPQVSRAHALLRIQTTVTNGRTHSVPCTLATRLLDRDGKIVAAESSPRRLAPGETFRFLQELQVENPSLWSVDRPCLYTVRSEVHDGDAIADVCDTSTGIRSAVFDVDRGFLLNGEPVKLRGVCLHQEAGCVGSAVPERVWERRLRLLREMGCNAIRTSHNPPAPELLDLCDRMGFVVMDEAFDAWKTHKRPNDYSRIFDTWHEADVRAYVRRDRNHPCVVLWSIGNEIPEQARPSAFPIARDLAGAVRREDNTRPITAACNHTEAGYNGFQNIVDVFGYNYKPFEYGRVRAANPGLPLFASETASTISSRGEYFFPVSNDKSKGQSDFQVSSYDLYAPRWATTPDAEFAGQDKYPYMAGEFVWTGFDYIGEPTPYNSDLSNLNNYSNPEDKARAQKELEEIGKIRTPSRSSYFGIIDLAGFPKDRYYLYQAHWRPDYPMAHILPHWTWPGREGQITPVHVYTSGDEAELFLNGKSLGRKRKGEFEYRLRWDDVKYEPGVLKIVAYKDGKKWATDKVETAGPAAQLELAADRAKITADGNDLSYVTVTVADSKGRLVPRSKNHIKFDIEGPGEIVAVDNGDATSFEPFQAKERNAYNGLALVIVRANQPGKITLTAHADGLAGATTQIIGQP